MSDNPAYESAPEVYNRGERQLTALMRDLTAKQLPPVTFGYPLA